MFSVITERLRFCCVIRIYTLFIQFHCFMQQDAPTKRSSDSSILLGCTLFTIMVHVQVHRSQTGG